ncbi:vWA domain-containing protein [Legionella fairfieldensis]|uniref:vWA domain-containing protein n=1 Tax=Legionella fairfieldensis TaxID=45064 RepID=UPI00048C8296|nr:VWA domain-containing protein [Legionella fairfieldensis]
MTDFHFLRPWCLLILFPLFGLFLLLWRQRSSLEASWAAICDKPLLEHLLHQTKGQGRRHSALLLLLISACWMIIALAGPAWTRLPVPTYQKIQPRVIVLDMSDAMLAQDLTPDRLTRARFKLHDLFKRRDKGQFGLIAYTAEPFVVSPLTDDAHTIDALLSSLSPDIMPVEGQRLDIALEEAGELITNAGFKQGQILVLTGETPTLPAIDAAKKLATQQIHTSVMPIVASTLSPLFQDLAAAGQGQVVPFAETSIDLDNWLQDTGNDEHYSRSKDNDIALWQDEGRWFLFPALACMLPVFRRGWLQRIGA